VCHRRFAAACARKRKGQVAAAFTPATALPPTNTLYHSAWQWSQNDKQKVYREDDQTSRPFCKLHGAAVVLLHVAILSHLAHPNTKKDLNPIFMLV
jgi:hypothetical protein